MKELVLNHVHGRPEEDHQHRGKRKMRPIGKFASGLAAEHGENSRKEDPGQSGEGGDEKRLDGE